MKYCLWNLYYRISDKVFGLVLMILGTLCLCYKQIIKVYFEMILVGKFYACDWGPVGI